ncbi:MAG: hypothetical protein IE933_07325 [Sphingomonadales bacterium]|nr:hypothetical protein [Sphingomonadales bacterium]MBD3773466.1 hypothetical protein [Paracoccaceae bacterium]
MRIGFLACPGTLPGSPVRRADAFEHDRQVAAIAPALAARGIALEVVDWHAPDAAFAGLPLVLLGTVWDYQDRYPAFMARIDALEAAGIALCNPVQVVRWNIDKRYLADLAARGAPTIPTIWAEAADAASVEEAFIRFGCERVVVKRQVGAGAEGQHSFTRAAPPAPGWRMDRPAMIQPFVPSIESEGELSFILIDGEVSHALRKRAAAGDYRIQSVYGGCEEPYAPTSADLAQVAQVASALPFPTPLYARIDMVRGEDGGLLLMEAELIEPYLYPEQGPDLGERIAAAVAARIAQATTARA